MVAEAASSDSALSQGEVRMSTVCAAVIAENALMWVQWMVSPGGAA
jgi:hypothetical protein